MIYENDKLILDNFKILAMEASKNFALTEGVNLTFNTNMVTQLQEQDTYDDEGNIIGGTEWNAGWSPVSRVEITKLAQAAAQIAAPYKGSTSTSKSGQSSITDQNGLYGEKGSTAEEYAKEAGFSFVDVSAHDHKNLMDKVVYEDCYSKVLAKYCSDCGYGADSRQEWKKIDGVIDGTGGSHNFALDKTQQKLILSDTGSRHLFQNTGYGDIW